eukprot:TRINITY_DN11005_c0_g1_i1.p1 TRINITY_DN11005_c0_g1~~TRINITY_DN11005_c0_g1_i1.p1  ORF type:complete len:399 (-),score=115.65 TRINITY_DN11005_c0_g1_i1:427-1623(-)
MARQPPEVSKYPPTEFSIKYAKVLAPQGKLVTPEECFGEGGLYDKDVEEKTKLAFKVTMKKLEKMNVASEKNKESLRTAKIDQVVECFPNTLLKILPNTIQKSKWSKKPKDIENWDDWWGIHPKILTPLTSHATVIHKWWEYTGRPDPGEEEVVNSLKRLVTSVLTHPMTIGKAISNYTPKRKKDKPKSIHLVGTDTPEATMVYAGFYVEILNTNPLNPIKLTLVSPSAGNRQLAKDCSPSSPMLIHDRCKLTAWDGLYHDFWERYVQTKKMERPDIVMAIHPKLEGEFWGPTVDLLLDENIKTCFTCFNKEQFKQAIERLDYVFAKYVYKGSNPWVSGNVKQTPHDPNMVWSSNQYIIVFQGRTVDMKTLTLIEEPSEQNLDDAEAEFERLLQENDE